MISLNVAPTVLGIASILAFSASDKGNSGTRVIE
jgi:hypothetical protein